MKHRKLAVMTMTAAAVLGLAACGQSADSSTQTEAGSAAAGTESQASDDGVQELTFWHSMDGVYAEVLDKQVAQFNDTVGKEQGIHVTPVFQNWPGTEGLTAAMSTDDIKNMPDVIQLYGESVSLVRDYKRTVWAEDLMKAEDAVQKADLVPNARASFEINGKMIGVPYSTSTLLLYYNQDYLDAAGVSVPKTIDEMAEELPVLKDKTDAEYGLNVRVSLYELGNWIATQGAEGTFLGDNNSGHTGEMTKIEAEDALDKYLTAWQKVVDSGAYKPQNDSINEEFASGMHAMVIMSSSRIPTIKELVGDKFNWGVAQIPTVSASDIGGAYPSGSGLFILNRDDDAKVQAAWTFEQYMISPEAQAMWAEGGAGYLPANTKAEELDSYKNTIAETPQLAVPGEVLMKANENVVAPFVPNSDGVDTVIKDAMTAFGSGSASKDDTKAAIIDGCNQVFNDYYRTNG